MNSLEQSVNGLRLSGMSAPLVDRTRRVYDRLASVYPPSTALFHSRAHRCALEISGLGDGIGNSGSRDRLWRNVPEVGACSSTQKERKAFFHGLLTDYAVALKLG